LPEGLTSEILMQVYILSKNKEGSVMNERIIKIAHVIAIGIILLAAIIATAQAGQNSHQSGAQATALNSTDRRFITEAAMGGMAEIELGRLATERGASDAVRQFGQRMVNDHSGAPTDASGGSGVGESEGGGPGGGAMSSGGTGPGKSGSAD
jgi:hypothetical protein